MSVAIQSRLSARNIEDELEDLKRQLGEGESRATTRKLEKTRGIMESKGGGIEIQAGSGGRGRAAGLGGARRWYGAGLA